MTTRSEYQEQNRKTPAVNDTVYKALRRLVEIVLPAAAVLYLTLSDIWGLPYATQVAATIMAAVLFLSAALGYSRKSWEESDVKYDGAMIIDTSDPEKDVYRFEYDGDPFEIRNQDEVLFRVKPSGNL